MFILLSLNIYTLDYYTEICFWFEMFKNRLDEKNTSKGLQKRKFSLAILKSAYHIRNRFDVQAFQLNVSFNKLLLEFSRANIGKFDLATEFSAIPRVRKCPLTFPSGNGFAKAGLHEFPFKIPAACKVLVIPQSALMLHLCAISENTVYFNI